MSHKSGIPIPFLGTPPPGYSRDYFQRLVSSVELFMRAERVPGDARHTDMVLTNLAHHDQGLETGGLFQHNGSVKISQLHNPHLSGVAASGAVGTITVSTP